VNASLFGYYFCFMFFSISGLNSFISFESKEALRNCILLHCILEPNKANLIAFYLAALSWASSCDLGIFFVLVVALHWDLGS
jgi:hypothetical protein